MYLISGGGYGGSRDGDGISNGCSTIGISKTTPIEIIEQRYPVLIEHYALHEGSGGAGQQRGGFGVDLQGPPAPRHGARLLRHGPRPHGPPGRPGRRATAASTRLSWTQTARAYHPPHLSKDQDILIQAGDTITVRTPGGGGYGNPLARDPALVARDVGRGYYSAEAAAASFGVVLDAKTLKVNEAATAARRGRKSG